MKPLHVLITSMGSTTSIGIAKMARASASHISIFGTDINAFDRIAGSAFCDRFFTVPPFSAPDYLEAMKGIVQEHGIHIIIPVHDQELETLARHASVFQALGCRIVASSYKTVEQVNDKLLFTERLHQHGIAVPLTYSVAQWLAAGSARKEGKWIMKPNNGVSSRGIVTGSIAQIDEQLRSNQIRDGYLIQQFVEGEEFTVDTFVKDGVPYCVVPRSRAEIREGLCYKAYTLPNEAFVQPVKEIVALFDFYGPINIQFLKDRTSGDLYCLECNPRFGGTSILSHHAGVNLFDMVVDDYMGRPLSFVSDYKQVYMTRYWEEQCYAL